MIPYNDFEISAHHNYLVNDALMKEFVVGNPRSEKGGYLVAPSVPSHENRPRISARIVDSRGAVLFELVENHLGEKSHGHVLEFFESGFRIGNPAGESLLEVRTEAFANGYLTRVLGRVYDDQGKLVMEPYGDNSRLV